MGCANLIRSFNIDWKSYLKVSNKYFYKYMEPKAKGKIRFDIEITKILFLKGTFKISDEKYCFPYFYFKTYLKSFSVLFLVSSINLFMRSKKIVSIVS